MEEKKSKYRIVGVFLYAKKRKESGGEKEGGREREKKIWHRVKKFYERERFSHL